MNKGESKILKSTAFVLGAVLALALVWALRPVSGQGGAPPALFAMRAAPNSEVQLTERGVIVSSSIRPGKSTSGSLLAQNQTNAALSLQPVVRPSNTFLDGLLHLRLAQGRRVLFAGTLGELREGAQGAFVLPPQGSGSLGLRAWLPASTETGYEGQRVSALLLLESGGR